MSARNGSDSAAPTWRKSAYGLAEPESRDSSRQPPPLTSWKSTGNLHGAGTLPRPWSRPRTGVNVQRLLHRLQPQEEDKPRPSWADQLDDGQTTDAPRTSPCSDSTDPVAPAGEARPRPRPRPRSMGVPLGLRQDNEEGEGEVMRSAGRRSGGDVQRKDDSARRNVFGAARSYDALDRSRESGSGVSQTRNGDSSTKESVDRVHGAVRGDSCTSNRRADASDLSKIRDEARWGEASPDKYVAVRVNTRLSPHRARSEKGDTDDNQTLHRVPHTQTLPTTARYKEKADTAQSHATKLSAAEASIFKDINNAAKVASRRTSNDATEVTSVQSVPEKRGSLAKNENSSEQGYEGAATLRSKTSPVKGAAEARSRRSAPPPDLISQIDEQRPQSGRERFRRAEVEPADDPSAEEIKREKKTGKVEVNVVAVEVKAVKAEVKPVEAEVKVVDDNIQTAKAEAKAVNDTKSKAVDDVARAKQTKARETENPNVESAGDDTKARCAKGNTVEDHEVQAINEEVKGVEANIIAVETDDQLVEEPRYKPVAAPRRLTAIGMTSGQVADLQPARRVIDLRPSSDDYKKIRPRGTSRLANSKEARTKLVPVGEA